MSHLFSPYPLRGVTFRNRAWVSPMCQYTAQDGLPNDWHFVHLGSRAVGGAGLVMTEATAVNPEGRISPADTGLWNDAQQDAWTRIVQFVKTQGSAAAIQLAHAGRKASTAAPWKGGGYFPPEQGGWETVGPSAVAFGKFPPPRALDESGIEQVIADFAAATRRAVQAGFDVIEIHAAHGYLLHQFLSPLANQRTDRWGGDLEGRTRLTREVVRAVRENAPENMPVFIRISATDWVEGGWDLEQSIELIKMLKPLGVDLVDTSSGALVPNAKIPSAPGYQVPFARAIREQTGVPTGAVGLLTDPHQIEKVLADGEADAVFLAREMLRDPYWPLHAAKVLGAEIRWPDQYLRAQPPKD